MRRRIQIMVCIAALVITTLAVPAWADENDNVAFSFCLTVDGKNMKEVNYGDIVTVCLRLTRDGDNASYSMYAMQDELQYNGRVLELVNGSEMVYTGIASSDIEKADGYRELYWNYLSLSGGTTWDRETVIGTAQFRVIGTSGVTTIKNNDYLVSLPDGSGSYLCQSQDVTIVISTDCTVRFHSNGGTTIDNQTVQYGERILRPKDPIRAGYQFEGWYTDITLSTEWDFDSDLVTENMSLYAKWIPEMQSDVKPDESNQHNIYWIVAIYLLFAFLLWKIRRRLKRRK